MANHHTAEPIRTANTTLAITAGFLADEAGSAGNASGGSVTLTAACAAVVGGAGAGGRVTGVDALVVEGDTAIAEDEAGSKCEGAGSPSAGAIEADADTTVERGAPQALQNFIPDCTGVLHRGHFGSVTEPVAAGTPVFFPHFAQNLALGSNSPPQEEHVDFCG